MIEHPGPGNTAPVKCAVSLDIMPPDSFLRCPRGAWLVPLDAAGEVVDFDLMAPTRLVGQLPERIVAVRVRWWGLGIEVEAYAWLARSDHSDAAYAARRRVLYRRKLEAKRAKDPAAIGAAEAALYFHGRLGRRA